MSVMKRGLNRASKLPLYHQLYEIFRGNILSGKWRPGDMIPPESELIEHYQVSRTTVRQVLDILANEDLIYRRRGRGTFVAQPTVEQGLVRIVNFTEDMRMRRCEPCSKVLFSGLVPALQDIAEKLDIEPGEDLALLKRLRLADGEPMGIEESHLVHRYCPDILQGDYVSNSLREALARKYDIRWTHARQSIRAILAPPELADTMGIKSKSPLLFIERVSYSQQGVPIEFLRIYYRADRYVLYGELQG
jgi:GntR family transcriptional regulator